MKKHLIIILATIAIILTGCINKKMPNDVRDYTTTNNAESIKESKNTESELLKIDNNKPIVIDFSATWCGPCQELIPYFNNWETQFGDQINFLKIDIDEYPQLANQFGVRAVPTIMFVESGDYKKDGIQPKDISYIITGLQPTEIETAIHNLLKE